MERDDLIRNASSGEDYDVVNEILESMLDNIGFIRLFTARGEEKIHLEQSTGEVVDYLVVNCDEEPLWLKPSLHHVPPETWEKYGI